MLGALTAAVRFIGRNAPAVVTLYLLDFLLFLIVIGVYAAIAPGGTTPVWAAVVIQPGVYRGAAVGEAGVLGVGDRALPGAPRSRAVRRQAATRMARFAGRRCDCVDAGPEGPPRLLRSVGDDGADAFGVERFDDEQLFRHGADGGAVLRDDLPRGLVAAHHDARGSPRRRAARSPR